MSDAIIVAIITGVFSLLAAFLSAYFTSKKTEQSMITAQAVTDTKLEELTREVRLHNNFAQRMPVVEQKIDSLEQKVNFFHHV